MTEFNALLPLFWVRPRLPLAELMKEVLVCSLPRAAAKPAPAAVIRLWLPRYCWALERRSPEMHGMP
ncbi:hypothetical protein D3C76_1802580 [compost metagenome]